MRFLGKVPLTEISIGMLVKPSNPNAIVNIGVIVEYTMVSKDYGDIIVRWDTGDTNCYYTDTLTLMLVE